MNVDHLVRLKLPSQREDVRDGTSLHHRNASGGRFRSSFNFSIRMGSEGKPRNQSEDGAGRNNQK
jgi:hypothetical protein